jgi:hypothetical protein
MYRSLKEGDPAKAIQELLKVDAKINDRVYNEEDAKNFAEALLQLESLPKEEMERALKEATDKRRSNGQIIIRDSVSMEPETAKRKYKKGQAVRFSAKAPERWKQAMKRGTGKSFPATDKCVVVGFSPRDPKIVYVLQEFRKSPLRISMEFIEPDNKGT